MRVPSSDSLMPGQSFRASGDVRRPRFPFAGASTWIAVFVASSLAACGGHLSERSYAQMSGKVTIGQEIERVRVEIENGTVGIDSSLEPGITYGGGVRRAADTPAELAILDAVPVELQAAPDPDDAKTLVVRGPARPAATPGAVMAFELGIRVPATMPLEVRVAANGHVTIANRAATTRVTTGRGDLRFENCAGGVFAKTGRGMVIVFGHRGDLEVQTMAGDMQAFVDEPATSIRLVTGQGTVQCHVAPSIEFDLDARAEIGKIGNGFGLTPEPGTGYGAVLVGKRGTARTKVILRTGSGHLSIAPRRDG